MRRVVLLLLSVWLGIQFSPERAITAQADPNPPTFQIQIPAIEVDVPIITARRTRTSWSVARLGWRYAGHLQGTKLPGQGGNIVVAAHVEISRTRPGPFFKLNQLQPNDAIILVHGETLYRYVVQYTTTVRPDEISYVLDTPTEVLTLITCASDSTPAGRYALRLIVRAGRAG